MLPNPSRANTLTQLIPHHRIWASQALGKYLVQLYKDSAGVWVAVQMGQWWPLSALAGSQGALWEPP